MHVFVTPFQLLNQLPIIVKVEMNFMPMGDIPTSYIILLLLGIVVYQMPELFEVGVMPTTCLGRKIMCDKSWKYVQVLLRQYFCRI